MANRTVYGRTHSENGWPMVDQGSCRWVRIPGAEHVSLQIREGQSEVILRAFAADFNAYVEPLRDADSACWTATNSDASSNHLSGTAMDLNWNGADGKTFRFQISEDRAYPPPKAQAVRDLIAFYEGMVFCGGLWSIRDWMHFQMGGNTYNNPKTGDFMRRKIRADGFSTYKRSIPAPPPVVSPATGLTPENLSKAMGGSVPLDRYRALFPAVRDALTRSGCAGNLNRTAMWLAQIGHESGGLKYMEEIASGAAYEGRGDLGNTQPGDGARFKGRGPIQVTGRHNYTKLSRWAFEQKLVPSATFFVDQPAQLASDQYGFLGAVWYWTVARPKINAMCDAADLNGVTRAINGGLNGIDDRRTRWDRCRAMGLAALNVTGTTTPTPQPPEPTHPGDDMALVPQDQWDRVYRELTQKLPSRSPLRYLDQAERHPMGVDTLAGMVLNVDGMQHVEHIRALAGYGHPETLAHLRELATADPVKYPDRQDDAKLAQAVLAEATKPPAAPSAVVGAPTAVPSAPPAVVDTRELTAAYEEVARLREENARLQAATDAAPTVVYRDTPAQPVPADFPTAGAGSTGELIGRVYDALEALRLADALPIESRAPLAALISVLSTKNGASL